MYIFKKKFQIIFTLVALIFAGSLFAALDPELEIDSNGNAVFVWMDFEDKGSVIRAKTLVGTTWGEIETISVSKTATDPLVAVISNGVNVAAVAVWKEIDKGVTSLYGAMLQEGSLESSIWTHGKRISLSTENVIQAKLRINSSGMIIITWTTSEGIRSSTAFLNSDNFWTFPSTVS